MLTFILVEKSIGDDEPSIPAAPAQTPDNEEEKIDTSSSKPSGPKPPAPGMKKPREESSNLDDLDVDEKGGISVRAYALGDDKPNFMRPPPPPPPVREEIKKEEEDEDEDAIIGFLKEMKEETKKEAVDEDDIEDAENMSKARQSTINVIKPKKPGTNFPIFC